MGDWEIGQINPIWFDRFISFIYVLYMYIYKYIYIFSYIHIFVQLDELVPFQCIISQILYHGGYWQIWQTYRSIPRYATNGQMPVNNMHPPHSLQDKDLLNIRWFLVSTMDGEYYRFTFSNNPKMKEIYRKGSERIGAFGLSTQDINMSLPALLCE